MAQQQVRRNGASSAFLWGGVFGVVVVVLNLLNGFLVAGLAVRVLRSALRPLAGVALVGIVLSLTVVCCYFLAGLLAARRARAVEPGIFAGLIAGSIAGLGAFVIALIGAAMARHGLRVGGIGGIGAPRLVASSLAGALVRMLTSAIVGTGVGALGALVGRPRGNAPRAGWSYPYQAGPMTPGMGPEFAPGATPYSAGAAYPSQTPPSPSYPAGDTTPTIQTERTPPAP
ncbi:MAG: hypothetical protein ACXWQR_19180 [Ktedonobacterales bacterium]